MEIPFFGGCACGAVRYVCAQAPLAMVNCHCRDCQQAGGSGFSPTVVVPAASFQVISGKPTFHAVEADSGHTATRAFCASCGASLFASSTGRIDLIAIRAGSLDDPSWFRPQAEIWVARAQPWVHLDPDVPHFPGNPPRRSPPT